MLHEEKQTETKPVTRVVRQWTTCDFCSVEIKAGYYEVREGALARHKTERSLSLKIGDSYPDNGHTVEQRVDICEECWNAKLLPWLADLGITPHTHETDW